MLSRSRCIRFSKVLFRFAGFTNHPIHQRAQVLDHPDHRYDNLPYEPENAGFPDNPGGFFQNAAQNQRLVQQPHYQNHFFTTIYDSDGANGFDPTGSFDRQNSLGDQHELEWTRPVSANFGDFLNFYL